MSEQMKQLRGEEYRDRLRFQVEFAHGALKSLVLANGGGIVALLTFLGNSNARFDALWMWAAFGCFIAGLVFTLSAYIGAHFSQHFFMEATYHELTDAGEADIKDAMRRGNIGLSWAIGSAIVGLVSFGAGAIFGLVSLT